MDRWTQGWGWSTQPFLHAAWPLVCKSSSSCIPPHVPARQWQPHGRAAFPASFALLPSCAPFAASLGAATSCPICEGSGCAERGEQGCDGDPGAASSGLCCPRGHGWVLQRGCPGLLAEGGHRFSQESSRKDGLLQPSPPAVKTAPPRCKVSPSQCGSETASTCSIVPSDCLCHRSATRCSAVIANAWGAGNRLIFTTRDRSIWNMNNANCACIDLE